MHIIYYDAQCPFCCRAIQKIVRLDIGKIFTFKPLDPQSEKKSMILLENVGSSSERTWTQGRATCRIFWLLGGKWRLLGWPCFLPWFLLWIPDLFYRFIAKHRHLL